jgi:hypothetical protein
MSPDSANHPAISDDTRLWRRVYKKDAYFDEEKNSFRPMSGSFRDQRNPFDGLSLSIARETTLEAILKHAPEMYVVEVTAGAVRASGCVIERDPTDDDPSHVLIFGKGEQGRLTKSQAKALADQAVFVFPDTFAAMIRKLP